MALPANKGKVVNKNACRLTIGGIAATEPSMARQKTGLIKRTLGLTDPEWASIRECAAPHGGPARYFVWLHNEHLKAQMAAELEQTKLKLALASTSGAQTIDDDGLPVIDEDDYEVIHEDSLPLTEVNVPLTRRVANLDDGDEATDPALKTIDQLLTAPLDRSTSRPIFPAKRKP